MRNVERKLIAEAKQLTVKILATREQRELIKKQADVAHKLAESINAAAEKGERSQLDAGQAKLEAAQFTNEVRQLNAQEATLTGELKPLLGMSTRTHSSFMAPYRNFARLPDQPTLADVLTYMQPNYMPKQQNNRLISNVPNAVTTSKSLSQQVSNVPKMLLMDLKLKALLALGYVSPYPSGIKMKGLFKRQMHARSERKKKSKPSHTKFVTKLLPHTRKCPNGQNLHGKSPNPASTCRETSGTSHQGISRRTRRSTIHTSRP